MLASVSLEVKECPVCGIAYAVPSAWIQKIRTGGGSWYCPAGHKIFFKENLAEKLQREKDDLERHMQAKINEANHARLVAEKGFAKAVRDKRKVERRIAHGVCPCCNKTFADVSNHMITEHKDFRLPAGKKQDQIESSKQSSDRGEGD